MTEFTEAAEAIRAEETNATPAKPREWWAVVATHPHDKPQIFPSREHAEARRVVYDIEYPNLGAHRVVRLLEMPA